MASENDPTITIEYKDGTWKSLLGYAKRFTTRDAGILKLPTAAILLNNKDGKWTVGASKIPDCAPIKITADVRGTVDTIFEGIYLRHEGIFTRRKHEVVIKCKGYGVKLLWDTITYPYYKHHLSSGVWTMKDVIEDFLAIPDSGVDTGITLVTDSGVILTAAPIDDFERESLLDALRMMGEKINYDGYVYDAPPSMKLNFKAVGTIQASPSIVLDHPFIFVKPIRDTEEIRNSIFPWGDIEVGYPPSLDRWTEDHDRWANLWVADSGNTVSTAVAHIMGSASIKITNTTGNNVGATLDISKDPDYPYVDCSAYRFTEICQRLYNSFQSNDLQINIDLTDELGTVIRRGPGANRGDQAFSLKKDKWTPYARLIGPGRMIKSDWLKRYSGEWYYVSGSDFTWKVKKVRIWAYVWNNDEAADLYVDGLYFRGGIPINPLVNASEYPICPVEDATSISNYGRRVRHIEEKEIKSFTQATLAGQRELAALKDPIRKVFVKKGAKTWAHPHEVVVLDLPEYEISSEYWRILEQQQDWKAKGNILRTTFSLIPYTAKVSTVAIGLDGVGGILRSLG